MFSSHVTRQAILATLFSANILAGNEEARRCNKDRVALGTAVKTAPPRLYAASYIDNNNIRMHHFKQQFKVIKYWHQWILVNECIVLFRIKNFK